MTLARRETQITSSKIWTRVADSTSHDKKKRHAKRAS